MAILLAIISAPFWLIGIFVTFIGLFANSVKRNGIEVRGRERTVLRLKATAFGVGLIAIAILLCSY